MGHPVLRAKARGLDRADIKRPAVQSLIDDMIETMIEYHGVGLAAPQVHESVRLFVAHCRCLAAAYGWTRTVRAIGLAVVIR